MDIELPKTTNLEIGQIEAQRHDPPSLPSPSPPTHNHNNRLNPRQIRRSANLLYISDILSASATDHNISLPAERPLRA